MGDIYRGPSGRAQVVEWCERRLTGLSRSVLETPLGDTALTALGDGARTVVYLPGTNFNTATSLTVLHALAGSGRRVVCADLPGQPGLSAGERPDDDEAYERWVTAVLEEAARGGRGQPVLVGHSRGAAVALLAPPDLVHGLVLACPAGLVDVRPTWRILRASLPWLVLRGDNGSRRLVELMAGADLPYPEDLVPWLTLVARSARTTGAPSRLRSELLQRWRGGRVAVLVGEHDCFFPPERIVPAAQEDLGATPTVVPRAGHLLVDQDPGAVVDALTRL